MLARCEEHYSRPLARALTECGLDGIGDDIGETIVQCFDVQDVLCGIASLEEASAASSNSIDRPSEVSQDVARPGSELARVVAQEEV